MNGNDGALGSSQGREIQGGEVKVIGLNLRGFIKQKKFIKSDL